MIQVESVNAERIRFVTRNPSLVEVMLVDGKMFVHSEPFKAQTTGTTAPKAQAAPVAKTEPKELDFVKEAKTS